MKGRLRRLWHRFARPRLTIIVHGGADLSPVASFPHTVARPTEVLVAAHVAGRLLVPGPVLRGSRARSAPDVRSAVAQARGTVIAFVRADAIVDREAWARALRRLDEPGVGMAQVAYKTPNGVLRGSRALLSADLACDAPIFAVVRRDTWQFDAPDVARAWSQTVAEAGGSIVVSHPVGTPVVPRRPAPPLTDIRSAGSSSGTDEGAEILPSVGWIGFAGKGNFGDELVLRAAASLLPGIEIRPDRGGTHGTVLGGGTLLNADGYYQAMADRIDAPGLRRLVLGSGVVAPSVKGWSEELERWRPFLDAGPVGVRGPHSVQHLRSWGWEGPIEVLGDPALALRPVRTRREDLVVLAPVGASKVGQVSEDDARRQVRLLVGATQHWLAQGREVVVLCAHEEDGRVAQDVVAELGREVETVHAGSDVDAGLGLLASAGLVVATRLHAAVGAAAGGTPFVGLAYRPKLSDFAASVAADQFVQPLGLWELDRLMAAADDATTPPVVEAVGAAVEDLRERLRRRSVAFRDLVLADDAAV